METSPQTLAVHPDAVRLLAHTDPEASHRPLSADIVAAHVEHAERVDQASEAPHRRPRPSFPEQRAGQLATQPLVEVTEVAWVAGRYHKIVDGQVDEPLGGAGSKKVEQGLLEGTYVKVELGA